MTDRKNVELPCGECWKILSAYRAQLVRTPFAMCGACGQVLFNEGNRIISPVGGGGVVIPSGLRGGAVGSSMGS